MVGARPHKKSKKVKKSRCQDDATQPTRRDLHNAHQPAYEVVS